MTRIATNGLSLTQTRYRFRVARLSTRTGGLGPHRPCVGGARDLGFKYAMHPTSSLPPGFAMRIREGGREGVPKNHDLRFHRHLLELSDRSAKQDNVDGELGI